ncbi:hypothetical protein BU24DRAFT_428206 [Aaosphaeria arxii CBS 175.79]|uniref:MARVEL domain-containing protein n=1 Tax=Aaosphaeria arxii CBS 175.79 TaxID=1450172 RepID=A0A6A5XBL4_9PLEO|nr:uncharacterized protein BU24DRAFT_428206 [Aaosphaeria arxii CBS 175.79]KAF2010187.1 hypothetical protein BU24DRAFT_428206 [Aaosphaeria arxii CBS 175.79]
MTFAYILPLRAVQAVFSIIVLGLAAYVVDAYTSPWGSWSPHSVNFMLFTAVWTLLAVAFLVITPSRFPQFAHKYVIAGLEALTMIFWFAAWVAVAALWGDIHCGSNGGPCGAGTAAIVFGAFIWLTFVATTVFAVLHIRRTPRGDTSADPEMRMQGV